MSSRNENQRETSLPYFGVKLRVVVTNFNVSSRQGLKSLSFEAFHLKGHPLPFLAWPLPELHNNNTDNWLCHMSHALSAHARVLYPHRGPQTGRRADWATYACKIDYMMGVCALCIQLGQASMNPPDLCLKCGGDFNFAGSHAWKAEVPPTSSSSLRGSRWPDLAVTTTNSPPLTQDSEYLLRFLRSLPFLLKTTQKFWAWMLLPARSENLVFESNAELSLSWLSVNHFI